VPADAILLALGVRDVDLKYDKTYKLLKGPFHAIVRKGIFVLDLYLQREEGGRYLPKTFIRRLPVGLGRNGSTPEGSWLVEAKDGGHGKRAVWYPRGAAPVYPTDPNYAFGSKGMWIQLKGIDDNTRGYTEYGIHSTNDPSSIGREGSRGCIRLPDGADPRPELDGIDLVFAVLYEGHSTVWIRP
jgi:hypothetical protein